MSHFLDITTKMKDRDAVVRALGRLGFAGKVEVHDKARVLTNYWGNPDARLKGNVVIPRKYAGHADVGFERVDDGTYVMRLDDYDNRTSTGGKFDKEWLSKLTTWYGVEVARSELQRKHMKFTEDTDEEGCPRIRVAI